MTPQPSTRERIRREAAALFRVKGYNGTSMAELATEVGMAKSGVYHHFQCKQDLLSEIIELTVNRVTPMLQAVVDSDLAADEKLRRAIILHTVEAIRDQDAVACFIEEGRYLDDDRLAAHVANRDRYEQLFHTIIAEGIESGALAPRDVGLSIRAVLGMCNSVVRWYSPDGNATAEQVADQFAQIALAGAAGPLHSGLSIQGVASGCSA
ncbi:MAG: TetR/AcrR family transcriptional regulator [Actinomycetia bacterium]|nr:TetR/AcrR family transcriptional regulator [Actinomycetes bacterium]MCP4223026.1 TetR/AcrR family transcriptional regulator [Actinomycetes bacterium]MCP5030671.1 TetR/AcrR family transcriptional regulator [Actinomycetes bacterium]